MNKNKNNFSSVNLLELLLLLNKQDEEKLLHLQDYHVLQHLIELFFLSDFESKLSGNI